jgi:hypothetical protein
MDLLRRPEHLTMPSDLEGSRTRDRWRLAGLILAAAAILIVILALVSFWLSPSSGLRASRFPELRPGMTRHEVEDILGGPPGDYGIYADGTVESGDGSVLQVFAAPAAGHTKMETWEDDRNCFFVFFDDKDAVVAASRANHVRRYPKGSLLAKVKESLRSLLY